MPLRRTYKKKRPATRRYGTKTGAPIGRRPRMTRTLRVQQNLTRDCRWFKLAGSIQVQTEPPAVPGTINQVFTPADITGVEDFLKWARCWEEYKLLSFSINLIPTAVGSESLFNLSGGIPGAPTVTAQFRRGNMISYVDQGEPTNPAPFSFPQLIVRPSAKLIQPRARHRRWVTRPKGNPDWGTFNVNGTINSPDEWQDTRIRLWGENFQVPSVLPNTITYYYYTVSYKVLFRGRQQSV